MVWGCKRPKDALGADPGAFVLLNGLRYVVPYERPLRLFVKEQFVGRRLADVLAELVGNKVIPTCKTNEERVMLWAIEISSGKVEMKHHKKAKTDPEPEFHVVLDPIVAIQKQDQIRINCHIHEQPVPAALPKVLFENETLMVVTKHAGIPCHDDVDGFNNICGIVNAELRPHPACKLIHRLDKGVSGILILGKGGNATKAIMAQFADRRVKKAYIARVVGGFDPNQIIQSLGPDLVQYMALVSSTTLTVTAPLLFANRKSSVCLNTASAITSATTATNMTDDTNPSSNHCSSSSSHIPKPSLTTFTLLAPCEDGTSLVLCQPHTGYQHQIRAHLQCIGHPIANDTLYLSSHHITNAQSSNSDSGLLLPYRDDEQHTLASVLCSPVIQRSWCVDCQNLARVLQQTPAPTQTQTPGDQALLSTTTATVSPTTTSSHPPPECAHLLAPVERGIWLHSWRYELKDMGPLSFESDNVPPFAMEGHGLSESEIRRRIAQILNLDSSE